MRRSLPSLRALRALCVASALALLLIGCASPPDSPQQGLGTRDPAPASGDEDGGVTAIQAGTDASPGATAPTTLDASLGATDAADAPLPTSHDAAPDGQLDASPGCPDVDELLRGDCSGCHRAHSSLDLASPDIATRLAGQDATQGGLLLDPTHPASSVLYEKLGPTPPFGARMPLSLPAYDAATLACVLTWIAHP